MKKIYGTTLWGAEFLKAIEYETDRGRLSRGKTYANTGKIYDIELKAKSISAKVRGNFAPFYISRLSFSQFTKGDKEVILKYIDANPFILAIIMNGKLPEELLNFFKDEEIDIFRGFDMSCNCYDYNGSYACKHITALYYMLTNEIDKNPFILLKLRGLDLVQHYNIEENLNISYPLELVYANNTQSSVIFTDNIQILKLQNYKNFILSMLGSFPPFASIDYKEVMEEFYKKIPRELPLIVSAIRDEKIDNIQRILQNSDIEIQATDDITTVKFQISNEIFKDKKVLKLFDEYKFRIENNYLIVTPFSLFKLFISLDDDEGSDSYKYLFYLFRVVYILIENCAFIPSVIKKTNYL